MTRKLAAKAFLLANRYIDKVAGLDVHSPLHNMREIAKQALLLEDHLFNPSKFCEDCIQKHLLTIEALAEEAISLDAWDEYSDLHRMIADRARDFMERFKGETLAVAQEVRELRKGIVPTCALIPDAKKVASAYLNR
jgi:hypothetical protein